MGIINCLTKKCMFCGKRKNTKYVKAWGIYGTTTAGNWYHDECIRKVCADPEKYEKYVDMAIDIIDRVKKEKRIEKIEKDEKIQKQKYIKEHCI